MDIAHNPVHLLRSCSKVIFALLVGLTLTVSAQASHSDDDRFSRNFEWEFEGCTYQMTYEFPWETYHFYQNKPRVFHNYAVYTRENRYQRLLPDFVQHLECTAEAHGLDRAATLRWVIAFVQQLTYRSDQGEYPKFPIETLAERGGDCEDTSILLAALLREMGYETILLNPPGHMAIAVACDGCEGAAYHFEGREYYYVETTAKGFGIGEIPEDYRQTTDKIMSMEVKNVDLWVLYAFVPRRTTTGEMLYFVSEDAGLIATSQREDGLLPKATLRNVLVDGKRSTSREINWQRR